MTKIIGTTIQRHLSPRIVTFPVAETEVTVADVQDTLQDIEDDELSIPWPKLRVTTGDQDLGGGVSVGLTMQLQNAQLAFAPRTINKEEGTVTTANAVGTTLIDSTALFITKGVNPGATVVNFTDQSVSTVISVDSEIQLTMYSLSDGTDNQWDSADVYKIWNEDQVEVTGGNTVAVDTGGNTISAVFPTFGTQVLKTSSSSATSTSQVDIEYASYAGAINIDSINGDTATGGATGSVRSPFSTLADALIEDASRGFGRLRFFNDYTFGATDDIDNYEVTGQHITDTILTFTAGCSTSNVYASSCTLTGAMDGTVNAKEVLFSDVTGIGGTTTAMVWEFCLFQGTTVLQASNTVQLTFVEGHSNVAGTNTFILDLNGTITPLKISGYVGGFELTNKTQAVSSSIDMNGHFILNGTNTAGSVTLRGSGKKSLSPNGTTIDHRHYLSGDEFKNIQSAIELLIPEQASMGNIWYVDPVGGLDTNVGTDNDRAFKTINYAVSQAEDNHGDVIFVLAHDVAEVEIDENVVINKNNISIRGSGHNVHIHPSVTGSSTITITGNNVSFNNLTVHTPVGGTDDAMVFTGATNCAIKDVRIEDATGRGLVLNAGCDKLQMKNSFIGYSGSHGVEVTDCHDVTISVTHIDTNGGDNIKLNSTTDGDLHEVAFRNCIIHEAGGWGANIGTGCETVQFFDRCKFILNTTGDINDNGITTYNEADNISDEVWINGKALTLPKYLGLK